MLDPKLRVLGELGVKLGEGPGLTGTLGGLNEGRDGAIWNDPPEPKDGLEGIDGACLGWLNDGLGWLNDGADLG